MTIAATPRDPQLCKGHRLYLRVARTCTRTCAFPDQNSGVAAQVGVAVDITISASPSHTGLLARDLVLSYLHQLPQLAPLVVASHSGEMHAGRATM